MLELTPRPTHVIAHISDTHLLGGSRKLFTSIEATRNLERLLTRMTASDVTPDVLVFTGDLADIAEPEAYQRLKGAVEPVARDLGAEIVWVMGNHDEREAYSRELFGAETDQPQDRVYDIKGLRVIALDTSVPGYHHGELADSQLDWLAHELSTPAEHGTVLALHHPPLRSPNDLMRLIELDGLERLETVVRGSDVRTILGGHLHYSTFGTFAGIPVAVASATCYTVDIGMSRDLLLSAVDGGQSIQLVHVYDDTVVHSIIPIEDYPQVAAYPASLRAMAATMTMEQIKEMVSSKDSEFNKAEREQSADL